MSINSYIGIFYKIRAILTSIKNTPNLKYNIINAENDISKILKREYKFNILEHISKDFLFFNAKLKSKSILKIYSLFVVNNRATSKNKNNYLGYNLSWFSKIRKHDEKQNNQNEKINYLFSIPVSLFQMFQKYLTLKQVCLNRIICRAFCTYTANNLIIGGIDINEYKFRIENGFNCNNFKSIKNWLKQESLGFKLTNDGQFNNISYSSSDNSSIIWKNENIKKLRIENTMYHKCEIQYNTDDHKTIDHVIMLNSNNLSLII